MIFTLYRLTAAPLMAFGLIFLSPFNRKLRAVLSLKFQRRVTPPLLKSPIWIHAASGEFEYAKAVIRECKLIDHATPVIVTYSSATYVKAIENFPGVDFSLPLPLDLPGPCSAFLKKYDPVCLLIARTDLWPEILRQTKSRQIPIVLFSYTQRPPAKMGYLARRARSWLLKLVSEVRCVSGEDVDNLKNLGILHNVTVGGDTRYDQVRHRLSQPKPLPEPLKPTRPALVAGSTWPEDEKVLFAALAPLLKAKRLQWIVVPHEPSPAHVQALQKQCEDLELKSQLYSEGRDWSQSDVLIVDQVGVLAELYQWGTIAFVGGSYRGSIHSVMEPLGAGLLTLVGPDHLNNREATEFSKIGVGPFAAVQVCSDALRMQKTVELLLGGDKFAREAEILTAFNLRLGASRTLSELIYRQKTSGHKLANPSVGDRQPSTHS